LFHSKRAPSIFYSIYRKLIKYDWDINRIWDIFAIRIIAEKFPTAMPSLGVDPLALETG